MDFIEIMNFCGFDLEKANEMVKGNAEIIDEILRETGLERGAQDVFPLQSQSSPK